MTEAKFGSLDKSHISRHKIKIRFINTCKISVSAIWINFSGEEVTSRELESGQKFDVETYGTHPWIFRGHLPDHLMRVQLFKHRVEKFEAYRFLNEKHQIGQLTTAQLKQALNGNSVICVKIVEPCYYLPTLLQIASRSVLHYIRKDNNLNKNIVDLGLPATIQDKLLSLLEHS